MRILFSLLLTLFSSFVFSQGPSLQGPFVPIGLEQVHTNGNVADVMIQYKATNANGQDVYASGSHSMDEQAIKEQAIKRANDPNGGGFKDRMEDDGWTTDPPSGGGAADPLKVVPPDDPEYSTITGQCAASGYGFTLENCIDTRTGALAANFDFSGLQCTAAGVDIRFAYKDGGGEVSGGVWIPVTGLAACQDQPPGTEIPPPNDPNPAPDEFRDYMSGDPAPPPNPQAPNPRPEGFPPPMLDMDFYRESSSQHFDMQLPSTPTPQQMSDQMTADYASFTQTAAPLSNPLPTGMSFQPAPSGGSGEYGSPLSGYGSTGNGAGGQVGTTTSGGGSTGGTGGGTGGGDTIVNVDVASQCEDFPNSLGCIDTSVGDEIVPDITIPGFDAGVAFSPINLSSVSGCPSPISMDFMGQPYDIEYTILCNYGSSVSPLILLFASLSGAMIMLGVRRAG